MTVKYILVSFSLFYFENSEFFIYYIINLSMYHILIFYRTSIMTGVAVLCLAFVFVLSLDTQEVTAARCRSYCDSSGRSSYLCTKKQTRTSYYYKACKFLWMSRCKKSYVKVTRKLL